MFKETFYALEAPVDRGKQPVVYIEFGVTFFRRVSDSLTANMCSSSSARGECSHYVFVLFLSLSAGETKGADIGNLTAY